jgi:hypothetical protein
MELQIKRINRLQIIVQAANVKIALGKTTWKIINKKEDIILYSSSKINNLWRAAPKAPHKFWSKI